MEEWVMWLAFVLGGVAVIVGTISINKKKKNIPTTIMLGAILFFVGGLSIGVAFTGVALTESDNLMDRLSWDSTGRGFIVVSTALGETDDRTRVCGVLEGDDDAVCVDSDAILNYGQDYAGVSSVLPDPGEMFSVVRSRTGPISGVLFKRPS